MAALPSLLLLPSASGMAFKKPQIYYDWVALNSQSTTRHIMRPATAAGRDECLLLKQAIRRDAAEGKFVVDAFADAAAEHSLDDESSGQGGLIGRRLRQGACRSAELDRACFTAPLGEVAGPVRSAEGFHLVLVEERLGLIMHDGGMSRLVAEPREDGAGVRSVLRPPDPDDDGREFLSPVSLITLVASLAVVAVLSDVITTVASSV